LDEKRFKYFQDNIEKYPLVKIISIPPMYERISGSKVREQLCKKDPKAVDCFVPTDKRDDEEVDLIDDDALLTEDDLVKPTVAGKCCIAAHPGNRVHS
jgi:hypothetical protein